MSSFFINKKRVYLDYAAGASGNPSSPHEEGRMARKKLENARTEIARLVGVQSDDVIFTSGATEANALAILGICRRLVAGNTRSDLSEDLSERSDLVLPGKSRHMLYLPSAHASIVKNAKLLETEGVLVEALPIKNYRVDTEVLARMLRDETVLVSMDAVCGETGVVWNTREVAEVLRRHSLVGRMHKPYLHVDASQAPIVEKITREHFGADLLTLDASKVCEVRGMGALIAHRTISIAPLYEGGGQERGLRSGSAAPELAERFAAALRAAALNREKFRASATLARAEIRALITDSIPNIFVNENTHGSQAPYILNLSFPGRDTDYLVALLNESGFAVSTRSACETDSEDGSRAVFVLTNDVERARTTLRISWGPRTSLSELRRFAHALVQAEGIL